MNSILAALVNGMLASAGLAFVVWMGLRLAPGSLLNAATRYVVWWAVLVVAIALPVLYLPARRAVAVVKRPVATSVEQAPSIYSAGRPLVVSEMHAPPFPAPQPVRRPAFPIAIAAGLWPGRILVVWFAASILMLIRLLASVVTLERRKARAWGAPAALTAGCNGSGRKIRVAISQEIPVPLVAGPWRPAILWPARLLNELSERELRQIGIHEAAHLARRDDYALMIQRVLEAVFALHPVVRWVSKRIDLEREIACDDFVIATTGEAQPYAACLARVVELSGGVRALRVAVAAAEDRSHLARRVEMLLDNSRHTGTRLLGLRLAAATLSIAALAGGAARTPAVLEFARPQRVFHGLMESSRPVPTDVVPLPNVLIAQAVTPLAPPFPVAPQPPVQGASAPMVFLFPWPCLIR